MRKFQCLLILLKRSYTCYCICYYICYYIICMTVPLKKLRKNYSKFVWLPGKIIDAIRSSHPEVFCKKVALRNFAKFTGKHLCQSLFFNKVAGQVFSCEVCEICKNTFFSCFCATQWFISQFYEIIIADFFQCHLK